MSNEQGGSNTNPHFNSIVNSYCQCPCLICSSIASGFVTLRTAFRCSAYSERCDDGARSCSAYKHTHSNVIYARRIRTCTPSPNHVMPRRAGISPPTVDLVWRRTQNFFYFKNAQEMLYSFPRLFTLPALARPNLDTWPVRWKIGDQICSSHFKRSGP